ncbi:hypothetical protein AVEN_90496-1 [Araneus ventricosus]|uniref:Uncharacterized protein n=1 Tax=Araneus ventricosus TaxID=182803 RepID=A0A4Y2IFE0_ARAVE|nr:hypothetical protein AVEN_90496-1 [Araneus ventricosus]
MVVGTLLWLITPSDKRLKKDCFEEKEPKDDDGIEDELVKKLSRKQVMGAFQDVRHGLRFIAKVSEEMLTFLSKSEHYFEMTSTKVYVQKTIGTTLSKNK